ncbi:gas vesicle protein GvpO, halophile-type [Natronococcus wangiae]|uniref:gas vesicle protein GvpO, halophile-type n=1 Tax=Natronococcus wangiae TaxID=3068275 RepID=UPI00273D6CF5|nr:gas vesicle protein [Natronococcus sp. AD5]
MAEADTNSANQCRALTEDGERCSRPAQDDGFCYQHDKGDPTVSDSQTAETEQEEQEQEQEQEADRDAQSADMATEETTDPGDVDTSDVDEDSDIAGVLAVRQTVQSTAGQIVGHEFDGVSEISPMDDGWRAVVEVVERSAVPDTQDIIGRYEIELGEEGVVQGYRRLDRYRRGDTTAFE